MAPDPRMNPLMSFRFRVEIDGITAAYASEVSGLSRETETEPYEEGGVNEWVHQLPKRTKYQHITLKRGITDRDDLWQWHQDVIEGRFRRQNGAIILMDAEGSDRWRWNVLQAFPVKWTGPELRAENSTVAFEAVELAHHGITRG